jgi:hypothetical protein
MPRIAPRSRLWATTSWCPHRWITLRRRAQSTGAGSTGTIRWPPSAAVCPKWIEGIADTGCIATGGSAVALADRKGNLYVSADTGRSWSRRAGGLPAPSSVLIA